MKPRPDSIDNAVLVNLMKRRMHDCESTATETNAVRTYAIPTQQNKCQANLLLGRHLPKGDRSAFSVKILSTIPPYAKAITKYS